MSNFCEQILDILKNYVRKYHNNNVKQAAQALGLSEPTLAQWLKGTRSPNLESIGPVLDRIGVSVVLCNTTARDVQLVPVCTDAAGRAGKRTYTAANGSQC